VDPRQREPKHTGDLQFRASYTSSKRRKVRKLKARGDVTVELFFGPDIARLAERWSLDGLASALANARVKPEV
jgi:hypothetical protein